MTMMRGFFVSSLFLLAVPSRTTIAEASSKIDLTQSVRDLTAGDPRLVRYDATEETLAKQVELCESVMKEAVNVLKKEDDTTAIQALILCITDNPSNRAKFAEFAIHGTILKYLDAAVKTTDSMLIASIGQLIWISTYGNAKNHQGFTPSVATLAKVFATPSTTKTTTIRPVALMWSAAALQNLAASYCFLETDPEDPGCYWDFQHDDDDEHVQINTEESGQMYIDGTNVRRAILEAPGLVDALLKWACQGPFSGHATEDNPSAALNAVAASNTTTAKPHEDHENIVPWAAIGAIKNLALLPDAKSRLTPHEPCFCRLSQSYDWLEHTKSSDLLGFLRPSFPCWFHWEPSDVEPKDVPLCVDHAFQDAEGNTCYDYDYESSVDDCAIQDVKRSDVTAKDACCGCGGGNNINMPIMTTEEAVDEL